MTLNKIMTLNEIVGNFIADIVQYTGNSRDKLKRIYLYKLFKEYSGINKLNQNEFYFLMKDNHIEFEPGSKYYVGYTMKFEDLLL